MYTFSKRGIQCNHISPTERKSREPQSECLLSLETMGVDTSWWLVVAPGGRWRVSLLTGGMTNVLCWSPNYAMQINVLSNDIVKVYIERKEQMAKF